MAPSSFRSVLVAVVALAAFAAPAAAAPSRAELENRIIQLENQLAEVRQSVTLGGDPAAVRLEQRMDAVQAELARVVGELEEARFQNGRLQNELRTLRRELQLRDAEVADKLGLEPAFILTEDPFADGAGALGAPNGYAADLSGGEGLASAEPRENDPSFYGDDPFAAERAASVGVLGATTGGATTGGETLVGDVAADNPVDALAAAKSLLIDGRFDEAEAAFQDFDARFGDSDEAGEALYWHGETLFARDDFEPAKNLYIESLRRDPTGPRAPDAMVQLAAALQRMNFTTEACNTLAAFPRQFPSATLSVRSKAERVRQAAGCR